MGTKPWATRLATVRMRPILYNDIREQLERKDLADSLGPFRVADRILPSGAQPNRFARGAIRLQSYAEHLDCEGDDKKAIDQILAQTQELLLAPGFRRDETKFDQDV